MITMRWLAAVTVAVLMMGCGRETEPEARGEGIGQPALAPRQILPPATIVVAQDGSFNLTCEHGGGGAKDVPALQDLLRDLPRPTVILVECPRGRTVKDLDPLVVLLSEQGFGNIQWRTVMPTPE